jgi:hypothetical protein
VLIGVMQVAAVQSEAARCTTSQGCAAQRSMTECTAGLRSTLSSSKQLHQAGSAAVQMQQYTHAAAQNVAAWHWIQQAGHRTAAQS